MPVRSKKPEIGSLNDRVVIEKRTESDDGAGGKHLSAWATFRECWASVETPSSGEKFFMGQLGQEITHKVIIRHQDEDAQLKRGWRVKWIPLTGSTRLLEIMDFIINYDYKFFFTTISCREIAQ